MKTTYAKWILLSAITTAAMLCAQTPAPPPASAPAAQNRPADPQQQLRHLARKLALTDDQQSQLLPILTDRDQKVSSIHEDPSLTPKERHARLLAVRSDAESRLRNVLTDTQRAAYDQMEQEARERTRARKQTTVSN